MGHVSVRHTFNVDVETFWDKVFFSEEYSRILYTEKLAFRDYNLSDEKKPDGSIERTLITQPNTSMPGPVQKVIGDTITYTERGHFDPVAKKYSFEILPPTYKDKIQIKGELWVEPVGDDKVERRFEMDCHVKIFGVGKLVEGSIEKTTEQSHNVAAAFTNEFIQTHLSSK